ncbi:hypothetical protein WA158_002192 [Blastocystis sp. Blastoise]
MWEIPSMGMFISLIQKAIHLDTFKLKDLESGLKKPNESVFLNIFISKLLYPKCRQKAGKGTDRENYEKWSSKLSTIVNEWYTHLDQLKTDLHTYNSQLKSFCHSGNNVNEDHHEESTLNDQKDTPSFHFYTKSQLESIQSDIFYYNHLIAKIGDVCPLSNKTFKDIALVTRVYILESLCEYIQHHDKFIQLIMNKVTPKESRVLPFYRYHGYTFWNFPMFNHECRVYIEDKDNFCLWIHNFTEIKSCISKLSNQYKSLKDKLVRIKEQYNETDLIEDKDNQEIEVNKYKSDYIPITPSPSLPSLPSLPSQIINSSSTLNSQNSLSTDYKPILIPSTTSNNYIYPLPNPIYYTNTISPLSYTPSPLLLNNNTLSPYISPYSITSPFNPTYNISNYNNMILSTTSSNDISTYINMNNLNVTTPLGTENQNNSFFCSPLYNSNLNHSNNNISLNIDNYKVNQECSTLFDARGSPVEVDNSSYCNYRNEYIQPSIPYTASIPSLYTSMSTSDSTSYPLYTSLYTNAQNTSQTKQDNYNNIDLNHSLFLLYFYILLFIAYI